MPELWLDITDIPAEGREFSFSDQAIWTGPVAEFSLGHVLDAPGLPMVRHWFLVWPGDRPLKPASERVRAAILGLKGSFLPE